MSWLFSRALVEAYGAANCSDGELSAPLSGTATPPACYSHGKTTKQWNPSRYGMTCEPLTEHRGEELLTWFRAAFRAKTLALPEKVPESMANEAGCGEKWPVWFARYDPDTSSWKTRQCSLLAGLDVFSVTWPRWGTMRSGVCSERTTWVRHTYGSAFGFLLPTLTVCGNYNRKGASPTSGDGLATALKKIQQGVGGPLNPTWCEWYMGWPMGATELKRLETDKFQQWFALHGLSFTDD